MLDRQKTFHDVHDALLPFIGIAARAVEAGNRPFVPPRQAGLILLTRKLLVHEYFSIESIGNAYAKNGGCSERSSRCEAGGCRS
jgi:hypothetical protein